MEIKIRTCPHRNWHASFRQILPMTALKFLDLRQQAGEILPCPRQNLLENPRTIPMWTGSKQTNNLFQKANEHYAGRAG